jgi:lipoprotein-anchoring transpeptidase ErfK/SrfK
MTDDELERRLTSAFDATARAAAGDTSTPPLPRFAQMAPSDHRRRRLLAPLAAAAAVIAVGATVAGITYATSDNGHHRTASQRSPAVVTHASTSAPAVPSTPVHIKLLNSDGADYGVGMPVVAFFSRKITNARALQAATTVTVNGAAAKGAWYFESSAAGNGPIEGHFRLRDYWPAHAKVHIAIPAQGVSAGTGLSFNDSLTLDFTTGPKDVAVVNDATHRMIVSSDGKRWGSFPVSLGAHRTPTTRGTKVIMEKGASICMRGPGYNECGIKYTQRLTYGGEYLHSAPWNIGNIEKGIDSSNGCTNLLPADAARLFHFLRVGDVVQYPNAGGPAMQLGSGYGDWNVPWSSWQTGGLVPTR